MRSRTKRCQRKVESSITGAATVTINVWYPPILHRGFNIPLSATTIIRLTRITKSQKRLLSARANRPYWSQSAIINTYDETDGFYDHEQPKQRSSFVDGSILAGGKRIPTIVLSPWSLQGSISHQYSEHG